MPVPLKSRRRPPNDKDNRPRDGPKQWRTNSGARAPVDPLVRPRLRDAKQGQRGRDIDDMAVGRTMAHRRLAALCPQYKDEAEENPKNDESGDD
jgi:hypothetical protein